MLKTVALVLAMLSACIGSVAAASGGSIIVTVVDAQSGAPLDGARVVVSDAGTRELRNSGGGHFEAGDVAVGTHRIVATAAGHRDASAVLSVAEGSVATATLRLAPASEAQQLRVIGRTASRSESEPAEGLSLHTTIGTTALVDAGIFRFADALDELPSLNATASGHTSLSNGPGASIYLDMRGLGSIETQTLIDGHPIGQGIDLGYNYQDAPIFGFRDVFVGYGTGASGLLSIGAVGGIVDMRTLEPTQRRR
ncbi:MAG: TonB-dependent receptor, partial [Candidatus Eremiobacteraeota bacterium]|nr:TonB-dependent receptor [Candidatus Eremiobacteraeota bacterium]